MYHRFGDLIILIIIFTLMCIFARFTAILLIMMGIIFHGWHHKGTIDFEIPETN
jgi:hypothetical protein